MSVTPSFTDCLKSSSSLGSCFFLIDVEGRVPTSVKSPSFLQYSILLATYFVTVQWALPMVSVTCFSLFRSAKQTKPWRCGVPDSPTSRPNIRYFTPSIGAESLSTFAGV